MTNLFGGKYLSEHGEEKGISERLAENYRSALERLPGRSYLFVTGGTLGYHKKVLTEVFARIGLRTVLHEGADSLEGLRILSEERT